MYVDAVLNAFRPGVCPSQMQIIIQDGRHPAIDLLMGEHGQYVPNHTQLQVHMATSSFRQRTDVCLLANSLRQFWRKNCSLLCAGVGVGLPCNRRTSANREAKPLVHPPPQLCRTACKYLMPSLSSFAFCLCVCYSLFSSLRNREMAGELW